MFWWNFIWHIVINRTVGGDQTLLLSINFLLHVSPMSRKRKAKKKKRDEIMKHLSQHFKLFVFRSCFYHRVDSGARERTERRLESNFTTSERCFVWDFVVFLRVSLRTLSPSSRGWKWGWFSNDVNGKHFIFKIVKVPNIKSMTRKF